jgi:hypothetical protein
MTKLNLFAALLLTCIPASVAAQPLNPTDWNASATLLEAPPPTKIQAPEPDHIIPALDGQWDAETALLLSQCLVGEADWGRVTEYSAISHLLLRRWQLRRQVETNLTFKRSIQQYCALHRTRSPSNRQTMIKHLPAGKFWSDPGFESTVLWLNYIKPWLDVQEFVYQFAHGTYADPTPTADHWGGAMDGIPLGGTRLPAQVRSVDPKTLGRTVTLANRFYNVDMRELRRIRTSRRQYLRDVASGTPVSARQASRGRNRR